MSKKGMKLAGIGIVGLVIIVIGGVFIYKKMKKSNTIAPLIAPSPGVSPQDDPVLMAKASRASYYNPYSYNARHALMSSISPAYMHKGYFSAPQHSIGGHNVIPAFSFDRDDDES